MTIMVAAVKKIAAADYNKLTESDLWKGRDKTWVIAAHRVILAAHHAVIIIHHGSAQVI